jgi:hypothetical protein
MTSVIDMTGRFAVAESAGEFVADAQIGDVIFGSTTSNQHLLLGVGSGPSYMSLKNNAIKVGGPDINVDFSVLGGTLSSTNAAIATLGVSGTLNVSGIVRANIASASNLSVKNTITAGFVTSSNITDIEDRSSFASNCAIAASNVLFTVSNMVYTYCNFDNSRSEFASNASAFSSNLATVTAEATSAMTTTANFGSNASSFSSNLVVATAETASQASNAAFFSSNASVFSSNAAHFGSNLVSAITAISKHWNADALGVAAPNGTKCYKIATLLNTGSSDNAVLRITGSLGGIQSTQHAFVDVYIAARGVYILRGTALGYPVTAKQFADLLVYRNGSSQYDVYITTTATAVSFDLHVEGASASSTLLDPSEVAGSPTGTLITASVISACTDLVINAGNVGFGTSNPQAKLDVAGSVSAEMLDVVGAISASSLAVSGTVYASSFVENGTALSDKYGAMEAVQFASNAANFGSNSFATVTSIATYASNLAATTYDTLFTMSVGSNATIDSSSALFASNVSVSASNTAYAGLSAASFASNTAAFASNAVATIGSVSGGADTASVIALSNVVYPTSTGLAALSNFSVVLSNDTYTTFSSLDAKVAFASNAAGSVTGLSNATHSNISSLTTQASFACNAVVATSNVAYATSGTVTNLSNAVSSLSNYAISTNTVAAFASNTSVAVSNAAFFASNASASNATAYMGASNAAYYASNLAKQTYDTFYSATLGSNVAVDSTSGLFASNTAVVASNTAFANSATIVTLSNVAYGLVDNVTYGSNAAFFACNAVTAVTSLSKQWSADKLGVTSSFGNKYYKIATLANSGSADNVLLRITGAVGGWSNVQHATVDVYVATRDGLTVRGTTAGYPTTAQQLVDIVVYKNTSNQYDVYVHAIGTAVTFDLTVAGSGPDLTLHEPSSVASSPVGSRSIASVFKLLTDLVIDNGYIGVGKSNPQHALDVVGTVASTSFVENGVLLSAKYAEVSTSDVAFYASNTAAALLSASSNYAQLDAYGRLSDFILPPAFTASAITVGELNASNIKTGDLSIIDIATLGQNTADAFYSFSNSLTTSFSNTAYSASNAAFYSSNVLGNASNLASLITSFDASKISTGKLSSNIMPDSFSATTINVDTLNATQIYSGDVRVVDVMDLSIAVASSFFSFSNIAAVAISNAAYYSSNALLAVSNTALWASNAFKDPANFPPIDAGQIVSGKLSSNMMPSEFSAEVITVGQLKAVTIQAGDVQVVDLAQLGTTTASTVAAIASGLSNTLSLNAVTASNIATSNLSVMTPISYTSNVAVFKAVNNQSVARFGAVQWTYCNGGIPGLSLDGTSKVFNYSGTDGLFAVGCTSIVNGDSSNGSVAVLYSDVVSSNATTVTANQLTNLYVRGTKTPKLQINTTTASSSVSFSDSTLLTITLLTAMPFAL